MDRNEVRKNSRTGHVICNSRIFYSILVVCILPFSTGCGMKHSVSPDFKMFVDEMPFKAKHPIARDIGITYSYGHVDSGKIDKPSIYTNEKEKSPNDKPNVFRSCNINEIVAYAGPKQSEICSQQADAFQKKGDHSSAKMYRSLAVSNLETEMAMANMVNNVNATFNTLNATTNALSAYVDAMSKKKISTLQDWIKETTGCIGDSAPEDSILHINLKLVVHLRKFRLDSRWVFTVTAVLEDGKGNYITGNKAYEMYAFKEAPPEAAKGFILLTKDTIPPEKMAEYAEVRKTLWGENHVLLANHVISDLYKRIESIKALEKSKR